MFVTLIGAIETVGDGAAIQRVSWRRPRAVDFKAVQGAVAADGVGNLLSGLLATVPNTTYSTSVSVTELTGVGARSVGVAAGLVFLSLAFLPKLVAVVLAIPGPVAAAYITVLLAMLFVVGMRMIVQDGVDYRKGLVAGVAFWAGVGFQNGVIYPEYFSTFAGGLLNNGMTAGGLVAMIMTLFVELTEPRRSRLEVAFDISALPKIREFLGEFASAGGWDAAMAHRLDAAGEETLLTLLRQEEADEGRERRRLLVVAHKEDGGAVLEFVAAGGEENLQDKIALLGEQTAAAPIEREVSLRLLRHLASSVRHQQYHDTDIVTVRVEASGAACAAGGVEKPYLLPRTWWSMPRKSLMKEVMRFSSKASSVSILPQAVSAILCFMDGIRGEDDELRVAEHQISEFFHEFGTIAAVILNEHAAVFEVMHLEALVDGPLVHAPADDGRIMGPRSGRVRIIGDGGARADADVAVAEGGRVARLVRGCAR